MLVDSILTTEGSSGSGVAGVNVANRIIDNEQPLVPCHSGVKLGLDGVLSTINAFGGFSAVPTEWLITGSASTFYVQRTVLSGTLETDPGPGFLQLNADRIYDNIKVSAGTKETTLFLEFSSDASGVPIVAVATYELTSEQSGFEIGPFLF